MCLQPFLPFLHPLLGYLELQGNLFLLSALAILVLCSDTHCRRSAKITNTHNVRCRNLTCSLSPSVQISPGFNTSQNSPFFGLNIQKEPMIYSCLRLNDADENNERIFSHAETIKAYQTKMWQVKFVLFYLFFILQTYLVLKYILVISNVKT